MKQNKEGSVQGHYLYSDGTAYWGLNLARNGEFGLRITQEQAKHVEDKQALHMDLLMMVSGVGIEFGKTYSLDDRQALRLAFEHQLNTAADDKAVTELYRVEDARRAQVLTDVNNKAKLDAEVAAAKQAKVDEKLAKEQRTVHGTQPVLVPTLAAAAVAMAMPGGF